MASFVEQLSLRHVESGLAGDDAQYLLRYWRENDGIISQDKGLTEISKRLMMFQPVLRSGDVPPATFIGKDSTFRTYLSHDLMPYSLPKAYRRQVSKGYEAAFHNEPWYDVQRTGDLMGPGTPDLVLERLVLKFRTRVGLERIFCLLTKLDGHLEFDLSDRGRHPGHFPQAPDFRQLEQVRHSSI